MEKELVSGISSTESESKITLLGIPDTPGVASKIFSPLTESNINVDMIVQNITDDGKYTNLTFTVNNSEFSKDASVSALVTGEPFGWKGGYVMNDTIVTGAIRNRPVITFTNNTAATRTIDVAVFIGG